MRSYPTPCVGGGEGRGRGGERGKGGGGRGEGRGGRRERGEERERFRPMQHAYCKSCMSWCANIIVP